MANGVVGVVREEEPVQDAHPWVTVGLGMSRMPKTGLEDDGDHVKLWASQNAARRQRE